ncbi:mannose-binding protein [Streptomyces sp. NPDC060030]|uniref:mannose-binding protein n=1 Tax=Streptomyces sp. NPDC060030 TaxID=3347042 RepID=UPI003697F190
MSSQPPTPGANTTAAAAPDADEAGSRPAVPAPAPAEETPTLAAAPGAESGATPAGDAAATPPAAAKSEAPEASEEGVGVATAAVTVPGTKTATGVNGGRPRTPVLAGAAFLGAALVAIPLLLVGSANDKGGDDTPMRPVAGGADTVLNPDSAPADLEDYVAGKPSPSPTKEKPKPVEPKAVAPVVPAPEPTPSPSATKPKAKVKVKPKPKPSPKPDWSTVAISAPSVIQVNQAWTTNRIKMVMQTDGNLVVLNEFGKPIWAAMTFGQNHRAIFQPDGNLVIHNGDDRPIWASKTHDHPGAQLVLRADGRVVVLDNGNVVWST